VALYLGEFVILAKSEFLTFFNQERPRMAITSNLSETLTEIEQETRDFFRTLNEKDRRRYVALHAKWYGHGGIAWIVRIVGCSRHTVERGMKELGSLADDSARGRIRKPGAGRKKRSIPSH